MYGAVKLLLYAVFFSFPTAQCLLRILMSVRYLQTITSSPKLCNCHNQNFIHHIYSAVVDCGTLDDPTNGIVSVSTTTYNSVANYSCNIGHTVTGDDMLTCLETGSWSSSVPTCIGEYSQ